MNKLLKLSIVLVMSLSVIAAITFIQLKQHINDYHHQKLNVVEPTDLILARGTSFRQFFNELEQQGILTDLWKLRLLVKLNPDLGKIRSGFYEVVPGETLEQLLVKLTHGDEKTFTITLVEGLTIKEWRVQLKNAPHLFVSKTPFLDILLKHGDESKLPEGKFFPNTYQYRANQDAREIISQSYLSMQQHLNDIWESREKALPLSSPFELLTLASIVEKETGKASERPQIAGVFINRLRKKMRLQTDPTVIYGMGDRFNGNITRKDLRTPTPFNTYTIKGLPPTPIAAPSSASLKAVAHPAKTKALYFVSRNDGSHVFSSTLKQHNRAVNHYQRNRKK